LNTFYQTANFQPKKMNKMHNYARKRFEQFCFIFHKVIAKITKLIFPAKILAPLILLKMRMKPQN